MTSKETSIAPGALDLIEQAIHLLRQKGAAALIDYYLGALPFTLGLLYFWSDMSRNPNAGWYCAPAAAGMALLFIWMKMWQARFCRRLWCLLNGAPLEIWTWKRCWSTAGRQALLHATGMVALLLAVIIMLPMGWVYAFYQNLSVLDGPDTRHLKGLYRASTKQAVIWPGQNHVLLTILSVFALFVIVNVAIGLMLLPYLFKWLLGIETAFTISGLHAMTNTTFLAIICTLTYLSVDPIIKSAYTLRCFYARSRHTGEDLYAALRPYLKAGLLLLIAWLGSVPTVVARDHPGMTDSAGQQVSGREEYIGQLDQTIERVLQERRFAWRLPREQVQAEQPEKGWLTRTLRWAAEKIQAALEAIDKWLESLSEWLRKRFPDTPWDNSAGPDWRWITRLIFYAIGVALTLLLLISIRRWLLVRKAAKHKRERPRVEPIIDINDENITADLLPRDRWLSMARELIDQNDFRMALRALYLAVLAQLGEGGRVVIARYKSNRDYQMELTRRVHAEPELLERFNQCMEAFERVWYGMHPIVENQLAQFKADQERIFLLVQPVA